MRCSRHRASTPELGRLRTSAQHTLRQRRCCTDIKNFSRLRLTVPPVAGVPSIRVVRLLGNTFGMTLSVALEAVQGLQRMPSQPSIFAPTVAGIPAFVDRR